MDEASLSPARAARRLAERRRRRVRRLVRAAVAFVVVSLATVGAVRAVYADQALPRTSLAGADVGGQTAEEIRALVAERAARPLVLRAGERRIELRRAAAGLDIDVQASVDRALEAGRDGALAGALSTIGGLVAGSDVALVSRVDPGRLGATVRRLAGELERKPFPGALRIDEQTLRVRAVRPRTGRTVDRRELASRLRRALVQDAGSVSAPVSVRAGVPVRTVRRAAAEARRALAAPLTVRAQGRTVVVKPRRLVALLRIATYEERREGAALGVDREALGGLVSWLAGRVDRRARDARLQAPARPVTVEGKGDLAWRPRPAEVTVRPARTGRALDRDVAARRVRRAVLQGEREVRLAVREVAPGISTAAARRVDALIGTFTTRYQPGQPRVTNIQRMAREVDGTLVAPGGQFSLNGIAGPRTEADGYVEAPFIADDRIVPSVGGGVSQFSTTTYNAAYFAGLRLDAHRPHSLFIDRYPAGREATLNFPDIDLRWTNDTDAPVLVRAVADATSVTVSLYGDNGGRRVSARTGARRPVPGGDFAITVTRVVRYADGRVVRQPYTTTYRRERDPAR